ncbi:putative mitochondrial enoyl-CoA hydratase/isomerase-like protein [Leptomonas pyrrhocoris]|uniref:Putative mitochondrial enoyl-CoA hydratase/isomerase-like protein n=1 Tax=Leptomonas pyrrhocoris TaxID=157538 RepID=A0A0N0DVN4_LEPPY|nr:putative mitochondrial enoyl-CoA hydratase/isomerase-like protein [Leptomonas pyrrhocoris]XP_015659077.1 putative mitochondrial enoyl-CoA hydratase/isomerase-like protein [Leptomonas pyrrhocoris]KPA80637.1 putative mitochondrial enoyl-CoA hydratase/isomerase-like protein [Leptomonas pyrrhocoris]KPA80638.1 putative mitochondrial enoyl-CoA hydratase/isomerase-like protein [Leptomonas pyrrhocoris]|eukprot:XP_015659076.1 putative mitochondrial enoyl-CoA hydratase/isomerase-like protein [Leptomonas pyrrhocoris]
MFRYCFALRCAAQPVVMAAQAGRVVTLTINRPTQLNALNKAVSECLMANLEKFDKDPSCSVFIITGAGRAFVAGADIKEMRSRDFSERLISDDFAALGRIGGIAKPIIAAVNGFALGGGCELAMSCDIILASDKAKFGQPEITLGTIPGLSGTQRLPRLIGKTRAMEWVLTGATYTADEAARAGLVARVVKHEELMSTALAMAEKIAGYSQVTTKLAKMAVNASQEGSLHTGVDYEHFIFNSTFATHDCKEGMSAFVEKRAAKFENR